jgi:hypothetical protein
MDKRKESLPYFFLTVACKKEAEVDEVRGLEMSKPTSKYCDLERL